ncbi:MAG: amino acid ABC transporter permease [Clostridia bacterium]|nr:amino acid ABC transporter permease [Clostridia bacterium]
MGFWEVTLFLLDGFKVTCLLFLLTLIFSLPLGLIICMGTMTKFRPIRYIMKVFVWIIRGIPLMLQLFIVFYVPGMLFDIRIPDLEINVFGKTLEISARFLSALIAFVINYACYFSEIYRGGIQSISRGQYEAGQVLGMTKMQIFFKIILKQVIKRILPPVSNEVITLVKDTALARVISVVEIIKLAEQLASRALLWPLFYTGAFYLLFVGILTLLFNHFEKKLSYFKS